MKQVAIIAGGGDLPLELARQLGQPPLICAMDNNRPNGLDVDISFSLSRLVPFLRLLEDRNITTIALAGAANRPRLDPEHFDPETASLLPEMVAAMRSGDDATLRWIIALIEEFGFEVKGVADLAPSLLVPAGVLTARAPSTAERADAERGETILAALAPVDVGQGCVVVSGLCLGVEALFGTDALLLGVSSHRPQREPTTGGVLVKRAKPGQETRVDLPTMGPDTVANAVAARLTGICVQADKTILLDRARTLRAANAAGLAIWAAP
tara:strand:+ start:11341 stop:12144 length:804 start_codon:yes stop_codon:yes gene_type:complete